MEYGTVYDGYVVALIIYPGYHYKYVTTEATSTDVTTELTTNPS